MDKSKEKIYPCADCGVLRSKDEGGTVFTVCDKCMKDIEKRVKQLLRYSRKDLAEKCEILENNNSVLIGRFEIQYQNCMKLIDDMNLLNEEFKKAKKLK